MRASPNESGLTLIEVTIATAIAAFLTWTLLLLVHSAIGAAQHANQRAITASAAHSLQERLESDAASAWGVWVPTTDVLGGANANGHELDFLTHDASHRVYAWAYRFDATTSQVTRYAYAPGVPAIAGVTYGPLAQFEADEFAVSALHDTASPAYDPLFAAASVAPYTYPFTSIAGAHGGNALIRVHIGGAGVAIDDALTSATAPAHFTIVATYTPAPAPASTATPTPLPLITFTPIPSAT